MYKEISYKKVFSKLEAGNEVYFVDLENLNVVKLSRVSVGKITGLLSENQKHKKYYIYETEKPA